MEPLALATTDSALADIYGDDDDPVPVLVDRFVQAGHRLTLLPEGRRPEISVRLDPIHEPVAVLLAAVPLHDVGGGSRGAQLAVELLRRGFHVTYVTRFASSESDDSGLRHIHPRLEQVPYPAFDAAAHAARAHSDVRIAICEIPDPGYLTAVGDLVGFEVVYDLVDDWSDPALGLDWYRRTAEGGLVELADAVTASAQPLVERLARFGAQATLVPNGVNEALFSGELGERPSDLPQGSPVLGYHGSLYGNWFDWEALAAVAEAWSDGAVVLIGDHDAAPALPPNVHFLGPRPQFQLPPYVGRFDVGLVPFTVTKTTHAVSPLKVFEYLAMGVPVAAPPLRSLHGLDGVHTSGVLVEATAAALEASPPDAAAARHSHGWGPRLEGLLGALGHPLPPVVGPDTRFELRRTVRYPSGERRLR